MRDWVTIQALSGEQLPKEERQNLKRKKKTKKKNQAKKNRNIQAYVTRWRGDVLTLLPEGKEHNMILYNNLIYSFPKIDF